MNIRAASLFAALFAAAGMLYASPAQAGPSDRGETQVFDDVYIGPNQTVNGDVDVVFGNATIAGVVRGDCVALLGHCTEIDGGRVLGKITNVTGDGDNDGVRAFLPVAVGGAGLGVLAEQDHRLFTKLLSSAIVVLVFLLFPLRMRVALDRVERHPALSAAAGAVAAILVIPIGILLLISIIGIPLVVLEVAGIVAGVWIGTGAVALLVGRRLCELIMPASTPSPLVALILGLVVVSAAEIIPVLGWVVSALIWLVGLGSVILSFVRSTQLDTSLHRVPIGGPPMAGPRY
ncbi:MAG TPA: hypothetical protein VHT05_15295 [Candidatus Elarobacter sp.]|nr:hypothetical protein [Candidatus Elarobacter sp.]